MAPCKRGLRDGREAIERATSDESHAIIPDVMLPVMDEFEVAVGQPRPQCAARAWTLSDRCVAVEAVAADGAYGPEWGVEAFNALNHPQLGAPAASINSTSNFGRITSPINTSPVPRRPGAGSGKTYFPSA
jgi:hypothetical protein